MLGSQKLRYVDQALDWLAGTDAEKKVVIFLGSTLGNLLPSEQVKFLQTVRRSLRKSDLMLLGVDTKHSQHKSVATIEAAYRDKTTATFITNIMVRANRELGADFEIEFFTYHAVYNPRTACVEMYLISDCQQTVTIGDQSFDFGPGEAVLIERSHKFCRFQIEQLANTAGFQVQEPYLASADDYFINVILQAV